MKNNYIIIHGSFSSPFENWFPWLRKEIEKRGDIVYTPDFPVGLGFQNYHNWVKVLEAYVDSGILSEKTIIFAHSIAPIFVCKFLVEKKLKVKRLVFVAGFNNYFAGNDDFDTVNESMYFKELEEVKNYCDDIICIYSDDDPYVTYEKEKEFAIAIATKQILIKNGGHLNSESGYIKFEELLDFL